MYILTNDECVSLFIGLIGSRLSFPQSIRTDWHRLKCRMNRRDLDWNGGKPLIYNAEALEGGGGVPVSHIPLIILKKCPIFLK